MSRLHRPNGHQHTGSSRPAAIETQTISLTQSSRQPKSRLKNKAPDLLTNLAKSTGLEKGRQRENPFHMSPLADVNSTAAATPENKEKIRP
jgi:hypothetical protein